MAKVYGQIGSLSQLVDEFNKRGISSINSLEDVDFFKKNYNHAAEQIKNKNREELQKNIDILKADYESRVSDYEIKLKEVENNLLLEKDDIEAYLKKYTDNPPHFFNNFIEWYKFNKLSKRILILKNNFEAEKKKPLKSLIISIENLKREVKDKETNFEELIDDMSRDEIEELNKINSIIEENKYLIYGVDGEQSAVKVLQELPDSYSIINNFRKDFYRPIYSRQTDDYIRSIQIDHIVIGPTGIFIIETKNWSLRSVKNPDYFSPVKQLKRLNLGLFVILNNVIENGVFSSFKLNWGDKKLSLRNIILMVNNKPSEEYQFVKILSLSEVNRYIVNCQSVYTVEQVNDLVEYLSDDYNSGLF